MKKLLSGILQIGVVVGVAVFSSNAFFSDTETSFGNGLEAGKLDLRVDYSSTYNGIVSNSWELTDLTDEKFFDLADVKPGDSGEGTISLHVSDNDAWGCVTIKPTANDDNGLTEPESEVDSTDGVGNGELAQNLQFRIWADICTEDAQPGDNIYQADCDILLAEGPGIIHPATWALADSNTPNIFTGSGALVGGSTYYIGAGWTLPDTVGNIVQTDIYQADVSFYTEQERHNPSFVCPTPTIFFDDFNDGNTDGWWLGYSLKTPSFYGNWRVEDGTLIQDTGGDGVIALIQNHIFSDQTIETKLKLNGPSGYGGLILWSQDNNNWTHVIIYPAAGFVEVSAHVNGTTFGFQYPYPSLANDTWYDLKVVADSTNGNLDVYLDGNYLFTHTVTTPNRTGQSGVMNGNAGGAFDDFKLTSN